MSYIVPKENWISQKAEIRVAKIHGKGLFAKEKINSGEKVVIRGGDNYTDKKNAELAKAAGSLVMQRDDDLFSIEDRGDDDAYFINHSCDGNLWMEDVFTLVAKRDIEKDEEITADYVLWEGDENKIAKRDCSCGQATCRKKFTGRDYLIKELQERYKDHFTPLLNKRILLLK